MCMARHWRMLPVPGFSDCSWVKCDVDRGRSEATRKALERANFLLEGYFQKLGWNPLQARTPPPNQ